MGDYATLNELRQFLRIPTRVSELVTPTDEDVVLQFALTSASTCVTDYTGRTFNVAGAASNRIYTAKYDGTRGMYVIPVDDTFTVAASVVVTYDGTGNGTTFDQTVTTFRMGPVNNPSLGLPYREVVLPSGAITLGQESVKVNAAWGWTAIPTAAKTATLIQASRFYKRRDSPFGVAGSPEMGNELRLLQRLDPDVAVILNGYVSWAAVA